MNFNRSMIRAVEQSGDRVTVADIASRAGLSLDRAEREMVALAAAVGGNLEVAESGDLVYRFPRNILGILRAQSWRWRGQQALAKVGRGLFFLVRMSFGIILIVSLVLIAAAIIAIAIAATSANRQQSDSRSSNSSSLNTARLLIYLNYWVGPNWYGWLQPGNRSRRREAAARPRPTGETSRSGLSFLDAVFSFLFGDGNPNADLEQRRWQAIAAAIRASGGTATAEQIAPYLDMADGEDEDYMLPVLARFNGYPTATEQGELVYAFPDLQVSASEASLDAGLADTYLHEVRWDFSAASRDQLGWVAGLGFANLTLAVLLGWLLWFQGAVELGGLVAFVASIYGVLGVYAIAFLAIPGLRYLWLQRHNERLEQRNQRRRERAQALRQPDATLQHKLAAARQLEVRQVVNADAVAYSTTQDLLDQNLARRDEIDREWQQRLAENQRPE